MQCAIERRSRERRPRRGRDSGAKRPIICLQKSKGQITHHQANVVADVLNVRISNVPGPFEDRPNGPKNALRVLSVGPKFFQPLLRKEHRTEIGLWVQIGSDDAQPQSAYIDAR